MRGGLVGHLHGIVGKEGAEILSANTIDDHVHLLLAMKPTPAPSDLVRKIKTNSSRWIHGR
ncbi:MAG: transposase, partial [Victivallales bacterium]|nr:transposase [Victivallales bacterium]